MKNLRVVLLGEVIGNELNMNKYSIAFNSLKAIIELESKETHDKIPDSLFKLFDDILLKKDNLINDKNIPLLILEQYYVRNVNNLNKELYIEYNNINFTMRVSTLYVILEEFYNTLYSLAITIADYYNLEIKLKKSNQETQNFI